MQQRSVLILPAVLATAVLVAGCGAPAPPPQSATPKTPKTPKTFEEKASFAIGFRFGKSLQQQKLPLIGKQVTAGLEAALAGEKSPLTDAELQQTLMELQKRAMAEQQKQQQQTGAAAEVRGQAFLAANAKKPGITVTGSGLQYEVLEAAEGDKPKATDTVTVHYRGTLLDGKEFDSSYGRGKPTSFALNRVIAGWTEGVQLMSSGSKYRFFIPSKLAYGPRGAGRDIGPNETLIFEIELLKIGK